MQKQILLLCLLCIPYLMTASKAPIKFGKVSREELKITQCSFWEEASVMTIAKSGELQVNFNSVEGWQYELEVVHRIKILDEAGKSAGDVKIRLYDPEKGDMREELLDVDGITYNLVDGKIEKTKLKKDNHFSTRLDAYYVQESLVFPDVQVGSVIEYRYKVVSDYLLNLTTWALQEDYPVGVSYLHLEIPKYFTYQINQVGIPLTINKEQKMEKKRLNIPGGMYQPLFLVMDISASEIPPMETEPYQPNINELRSRIEFQLLSYESEFEERSNFATDYMAFDKRLMDSEAFGKRLSKGGFFRKELAVQGETRLDKAQQILEQLQQRFNWNEEYTVFSDDAGRKAWNEQVGDVADINLSLVAALREFGLETYPVILSARGNGLPHPTYPNYNDFNYVVALIVIDDVEYFADATGLYPLGTLPLRCLNDKGRVMSEPARWIDMKKDAAAQSVVFIECQLEEDELKQTVKVMENGYSCHLTSALYKEKGDEGLAEEFLYDPEVWTVQGLTYEEDIQQEKARFEMELVTGIDDPDLIYLSPLTGGALLENPFVQETRYSNVDYPFTVDTKVVFQMNLPEGYTAEVPPPHRVQLLEDGGFFSYKGSYNPTTRSLLVISHYRLDRTSYAPQVYPYLREFYKQMEEKNGALLVLSRVPDQSQE